MRRLHSLQPFAAWTILLAMSGAAMWLVAAYGFTMPHNDEWAWLPIALGDEPVSLSWLWSQHAEHRMFLPRLIYLGLAAISGLDFRAGTIYNVLALTGLSAVLMLTVRAIRGRTTIYDAFFPMALLHWGHFVSLGWGFQLNFVTSVVLTGLVLAVIARTGGQLSLRAAAAAAVLLLGTGLCGCYGLVYVPPLACWLVLAAVARWRAGGPHAGRDALAMVLLAVGLLALVGLYFVGFARPTRPSSLPVGLLASLRTSLQFLAGALGPAGKEIWPVSGLLVLGGLLLSGWHAMAAAWHQPADRLRSLGLAGCLAAAGVLTLAIGWGRAVDGPTAGFSMHYMILPQPLLCLFYLQAATVQSPSRSRHIQQAMFLFMAVLLAVNTYKGLHVAAAMAGPERALQRDACEGLPQEALAVRYGTGYPAEAVFARRLEALRDRGLGPYRNRLVGGQLSAMRVTRMTDIDPEQPVASHLQLAAGQSVAQAFRVEGPGSLCRIDIELGKWHKSTGAGVAEWGLTEFADDGRRRVVRQGTLDLRALADYDCVSLGFSPVAIEGTRRFQLTIRMPDEGLGGRYIDVPLYECRACPRPDAGGAAKTGAPPGLKGFLFLTVDQHRGN